MSAPPSRSLARVSEPICTKPARASTFAALVKKYADQPFALVGVNNDSDRAKLKPFFAKHQITWPSIYDGADNISKQWNIKGFPAVFVVDVFPNETESKLIEQTLDVEAGLQGMLAP